MGIASEGVIPVQEKGAKTSLRLGPYFGVVESSSGKRRARGHHSQG